MELVVRDLLTSSGSSLPVCHFLRLSIAFSHLNLVKPAVISGSLAITDSGDFSQRIVSFCIVSSSTYHDFLLIPPEIRYPQQWWDLFVLIYC